jgi:hypothetical protein
MHDNFEVEPAVLRAKITGETARIPWPDLQRFYAAGSVIEVDHTVDLIDVAYAFATDAKDQVALWLSAQQIRKVEPAVAQQWYDTNQELWAVVVSPWVLVQHRPVH